MVFGLFRKSKPVASVNAVYGDIVAAARWPVLYRDLGVPDTVMGRFEALTLHAALMLSHLKTLPPPADNLGQELVDRLFAELDAALREVGIGDVSVPKKIKKLAQAFYGRAQAYESALAADAPALALEEALARNVLDRPDQPGLATVLAQHVRHVAAQLAVQSLNQIVEGRALQSTLETTA
jgi:cytochrome b pre-mRNA-processing protein 3